MFVRKDYILQDSETEEDNNLICFFQIGAGCYMQAMSREDLLADKICWGSGADPSHLDDWWLSLNA